MMKSMFVTLLAVASIAVAAPAAAQITQIDPNDAARYEPVTSNDAAAPTCGSVRMAG